MIRINRTMKIQKLLQIRRFAAALFCACWLFPYKNPGFSVYFLFPYPGICDIIKHNRTNEGGSIKMNCITLLREDRYEIYRTAGDKLP